MDSSKFHVNGITKFHQGIISHGFEINRVDDCIYPKFSGSRYIFQYLYVDDI